MRELVDDGWVVALHSWQSGGDPYFQFNGQAAKQENKGVSDIESHPGCADDCAKATASLLQAFLCRCVNDFFNHAM